MIGYLLKPEYNVRGLYINRDVDSLIIRISTSTASATESNNVLSEIAESAAKSGWQIQANGNRSVFLEANRVTHETQWVYYSVETIRLLKGKDSTWYLGYLQADMKQPPSASDTHENDEFWWAERNLWPMLRQYAEL